jgi:NADPH-dependent glutamate synthase beta subunit-like oxidoreductase/ferredoxin
MRTRYVSKKVDKDWLNTNFPCMMACPAHTNAGRYVALIAQGRFAEAYRFARDPNPLASICGRVCARPCEAACRRGQIDQPVAIRALKRFLTERYGPDSQRPIEARRAAAKLPFKIAIVGSGPVGISAAYDLALMGYSVTIFEAAPVAGGMLYLGNPEYRLPGKVVEAQLREVLATGDITLRLNHAAGRDFSFSELRRGFDAVLLAVGAHCSHELDIPGVELDGVYRGIEFLFNLNLGYEFTIGKRVVVIGGGNVAMDVARSAAREVLRKHGPTTEAARSKQKAGVTREMAGPSRARLGSNNHEVRIVCLEHRHEMPAAVEEIEEAERENILIHAGFGPKRILGREGKVTGIETLNTRRVFDENGRFSPAFHDGTEKILDCDTVIMAIGQRAALEFLLPEDGVQVSPFGLIAVNPDTLMTSAPGVFAGGDCVFGPSGVIDSVGDGKRAAAGIDAHLRGCERQEPRIEVELLDCHSMFENFAALSRLPMPKVPLEQRTGMAEVEMGFDEQSAMQEARRCLRCWINTVFEAAQEDHNECTLCGECVDACPEGCLEWAPLEQIEFEPGTLVQMRENPQLFAIELGDISAEELGTCKGTAMIKDETRCIRCGLCALCCPVNAISMESYHVASTESTGLIPLRFFDSF